MKEETAIFFKKLAQTIAANVPFVVYRKPNENLVTVVVQNTTKLYHLNTFLEKGFVFSPYSKTAHKIIFPASKSKMFEAELSDFEDLGVGVQGVDAELNMCDNEVKNNHILLTKKAIDFIQHKNAEKIVISRKEVLERNNFEVLNSYKKMLKNYKNAMVYLWFHPKVGCWMGASPERLIHMHKNEFKTMALAGTQSFENTTEVVWKTKEKEEQQFVTDYILDTVKDAIKNIKISKPYTVKAGSLLHLRTDISGELKCEDGLGNLIDSLHPTPAVCGLPKHIATNFILENEMYDRSFYTGYLGELNVKNETNLYVNLRCMEIEKNQISLFVGGGITKDSLAENEWRETVFKAEIMKEIL
ncbi:isochorismate synthase [Lutibacter holmesii]|uniref:isochorismate synthase n=1 Tax=Lutibacter holmesii TaxID=1137985 RepID=A0ABW3WK16_9FLAO